MQLKFLMNIDLELLEALRNAVWRIGPAVTVSGIITTGARKELASLEKKYNGGRPFPLRQGPIPRDPRKPKKIRRGT